uniref:Uncharacterized protein n=1 Tax=Oryza nivara TaxID=4536 RepID=A0A0E0HL27_ORYNI
MGSGDWFKTIISKKKSKRGKSKHAKVAGQVPNGPNSTNQKSNNGPSSSSDPEDNAALEEWAATRIQNAFRCYKAKKTLRCLKGVKRLHIIGQTNPVNKQTAATLNYIQSWNKLQAEIRNRRAFMVTEGRNRKKKQENQMKLEAKLQNLQVEWNGGSDTMEEILGRIQQREEAAVKRERAMAYAFNHQWRARSATSLGNFNYEVGKGGWGWSWMDRWIAARPWEPRSLVHPENLKKGQAKKENASTNPSALKLQGSISLSNNINDRKAPKKKVQKAKAAGPPKAKPKDMKGGQQKKQQQLELPLPLSSPSQSAALRAARRAPRAAAGPPRRRDDRLLLSGVVDVSQSPSALPSPPPSAVAPGAGPPPLRRARSYPRRTSRDPGNGEAILPATSRHTRRRGDPGWQAVILDPRPRDEATPGARRVTMDYDQADGLYDFPADDPTKKTLRCLKGVKRLHIIGQTNPVNKQTAPTLNYIQSWNKLQAEIRNRRAFMVTEGRNRKTKQEN